jgi:hypothetical protein
VSQPSFVQRRRTRTSRALVWSLLLQFLKQRKLSPPRFQTRRRRRRAVWRTRRHDGQGQPLSVAAKRGSHKSLPNPFIIIYYKIFLRCQHAATPALSGIIVWTLELCQQPHWRMPVFCFSCPQFFLQLRQIHLNQAKRAQICGKFDNMT